MQSFVHYFLHLGFPFLMALVFFRNSWKTAYLILLATMLVDLDHLLADPVFAPNRCSIQFHPLHTYYAMLLYLFLLFLPKPWKIISIGLLLHMATDLIDCLMTYSRCKACLDKAPAIDLLRTLSELLGI